MAFDPLPAPSSFASSVLAIERQLSSLEAQLRALAFNAGASGNLFLTANGMVEVTAVQIPATAVNTVATTGQPDLVDLAARLLALANQAFTAASSAAAAQSATTTGTMNLLNLCVPNGAFPNFAGFQDTANTLIAQKPAISARVAAMRFTGQAGSVTAVLTGTLSVASLTISSLPDHLPVLERDVADAINRARRGGDAGIDKGIGNPTSQPATVAMTGLCLYAHGNLSIKNAVKIVGGGNTFAAVANAAAGTTALDTDAQVGDIWSRAPVTLADRVKVTGSVRSNLAVTPATSPGPAGQVVTGQIVANGFIQLPGLNLAVTFPTTNLVAVNLDPGSPPKPVVRAIAPGAWGAVTVKPQCTLQLKTGTYTFDTLDLESGGTLSLDSKAGQVVVHVKGGNFIFRGAITERTGGSPRLFMSCFTTSGITIGSRFIGTFVAPNASVDLISITAPAPGHTGAFFAKDLMVEPNQTITFVPFSGTPSLGTV
jgi:DNA-binding protein YbaB